MARLVAAAVIARFFECFFDGLAGLTCALLNASEELLILAFDKLKVVVRERRPLLLQLALDDVPVAFDFQFSHGRMCFGLAAVVTVEPKITARGSALPWGETLPLIHPPEREIEHRSEAHPKQVGHKKGAGVFPHTSEGDQRGRNRQPQQDDLSERDTDPVHPEKERSP